MEIRKLWKYFIVLFFINFVLINWVDYGWFFNYRAMAGLASGLFQEEKPIQLMSEDEAIASEIVSEKIEAHQEKEKILEIPRIGVSAPVVFFDEPTDNDTLSKALDEGTVHFPDSVLPGQTGPTIILGHSAPPGWPKIKYDWVFSEVSSLEEGDEIFIYFGAKEHIYRVKSKVFLDRGEEIPAETYSSSGNTLILLSCWPPGKDYKRIAVIAGLLTK
jgi:LPXTG-site transpeptidase (sortase) family protein